MLWTVATLAFFAALHVLGATYRAVKYLLPGKPSFKRYGGWAVVTGSTDGIGKAFAEELAREGVNVLLVSRTEDKLKAVSDEISQKFGSRGGKVDYVVADLASSNPDAFKAIEAKFREIEVGILVRS